MFILRGASAVNSPTSTSVTSPLRRHGCGLNKIPSGSVSHSLALVNLLSLNILHQELLFRPYLFLTLHSLQREEFMYFIYTFRPLTFLYTFRP